MRTRVLVAALVAVGACHGSSSAPAVDATAMEPPLDPAPPAGGQQIASTTFHLEPGDEKYMCYQFRSPDDLIAITHVASISEVGVHHMAVFQAFGHEEPEQPHECDTLIKQTWLPIFVSGTGAHDLAFPDNTGFEIQPGTQYILQLHLQNATDGPLDVRAGVNFTYDHNPDQLTQAGIYAIGNDHFTIPANAMDYQVKEDCTPAKTMNLFGLFPHMHKAGTRFDVTRTIGGVEGPFYSIDPWQFGNQPVDAVSETIAPSDSLHVTCHWDNPSSAPIGYGESSDDEMCYFVMFYYPYDGLDGCID